VAVTLAACTHSLVTRAADDGPGTPAAKRKAAFARFWRGATGAAVTVAGPSLAVLQRTACGWAAERERLQHRRAGRAWGWVGGGVAEEVMAWLSRIPAIGQER
jgi:hypothetical protein